MVAVISEHIQIVPGICGGKPHITGHRIRVQDIVVWHEKAGMSPDEIVSRYPSLGLADVYAALAYYHDHFLEIRQHIQESNAFVEQLQEKIPSKVAEKLKRTHLGQD